MSSKRNLKNETAESSVSEGGCKINRYFTREGTDPLSEVKYAYRRSIITNPDGSEVFKMENAEIPESWSQLATDIVVSKYFRKAGVPGTGSEISVRQVVYRLYQSQLKRIKLNE